MARLTGVFGGTFDPPHHGHRILADEARHAFGLEKVLWVVTALPPHKPGRPISPIEVRVQMVQAAIAGDPGFELSRADIDRPGPHYTLDTLRWLSDRSPGMDWVYLIGSDSLHDLPTWHEPLKILDACAFLAVMERPGVDVDFDQLERDLPGIRQKARFFVAPWVEISGREIRDRVCEGRAYRYLVPPGVPEIIEHHRLYR